MKRAAKWMVLAALLMAQPASAQSPAESPPEDDWRSEISVFRVGIAASGPVADASAKVEPFRLALEEALGIPVEIFAARDYSALIGAHADSRIEYSILSATAYAAASNICECIEPLAIASSDNGATAFRNVVIVRDDGPSSIERMRGRKLAILETGTVGGGLLALHQLSEAGLIGGSNPIAIERFEASADAFAALRAGIVDGYLGWTPAIDQRNLRTGRGTLQALQSRQSSQEAGYRIIWESSDIPQRVHAIRDVLPSQAKAILRSTLAGLFGSDPVAYDSIEPIYGGGFVAARQSQFAPLAEALEKKGIRPSQPDRSDDGPPSDPSQ